MNDDNEIKKVQEKMHDCIRSINRLAPLVGTARQVKEFNADQRKNALAAAQVEFIKRGESVAGAEILARAHPAYIEKLNSLGVALADANATIAEWEATFARLEAARSIHAMMKETLKTLEG